jgi:methylphosphotriester-DNA--protein-cysteine methyltransferase
MGSVLIMTEQEYTRLCAEEPDLKLPSYWHLHHSFIEKITLMTPAQLSAARRVAIVARRLRDEAVNDYNSRDDVFAQVHNPETGS